MRNPLALTALMPVLCLLAACGSGTPTDKPPPSVPEVTASWQGESTEYCSSGTRILQGDVQGAAPDEVELLRNDQRVAALAPPYQFLVDCDQEPQGSYVFLIRARIGSRSFISAPKTLVIDRIPPSIVETSPPSSMDIRDLRKDTPIFFRFSEPMQLRRTSPTDLTSDYASLRHYPTLSEDGRTLTLVPAEPLRAPAQLDVLLYKGGITDAAGLPLTEGPTRLSWYLMPFIRMGAAVESVSSIAIARAPSGTPWMASRSISTSGITVRRWTAEGWKAFGTELPGTPNGSQIALTIGPNEEPIVASEEEPTPGAPVVRVMRWSNGGWQQLGGTLDGNASAHFVQWLSVDGDNQGKPTVAWHEGHAVHLRRWTGTAWEVLSSIGQNGDDTENAVVAVDSQNRVVLAYSQQLSTSSNERVFVKRWEGNAWVQVGTTLASDNAFSITDVDLTLGPGDAPAVAWIEDSSGYQVFAARWAGGAWQTSPQLGNAYLDELSIAADANGRVIVAWWNADLAQGLNRRLVYTGRFENGGWSRGVTACLGDDPYVSFTAEGTPMLWATFGQSTVYQPSIEH